MLNKNVGCQGEWGRIQVKYKYVSMGYFYYASTFFAIYAWQNMNKKWELKENTIKNDEVSSLHIQGHDLKKHINEVNCLKKAERANIS